MSGYSETIQCTGTFSSEQVLDKEQGNLCDKYMYAVALAMIN